MKWKLIEEATTIPCDKETIELAYRKGSDTTKYTPTVEFAKSAYDKLNANLFANKLISSHKLRFSVGKFGLKFTGRTDADMTDNSISVEGITLNSSIALTTHGWMEVILHEMIHILDITKHLDHFKNKNYNPHGDWFMEQANSFKRFGFDVDEKYIGKLGRGDGDEPNDLYIKLCDNPLGFSEMIKVDGQERNSTFKRLKKIGYKKVSILKSDNPMSDTLELSKYDEDSGFSVYHMTSRFNSRFGPFKEIEVVDMSNVVDESTESRKEIRFGCLEVETRPDGSVHYTIY